MKRDTQATGSRLAPKRQRPAEIPVLVLDCMYHIAEFMEYDDLLSMAQTCWYFRDGVGPALERTRIIATGLLKHGFAPYTKAELWDHFQLDWMPQCVCDPIKYIRCRILEEKALYDSGGLRVSLREAGADPVIWCFDFYVKGLLFKSSDFGMHLYPCEDPDMKLFGIEEYEKSIPGFKYKRYNDGDNWWDFPFECADKSTDCITQMIQMHINKIQDDPVVAEEV